MEIYDICPSSTLTPSTVGGMAKGNSLFKKYLLPTPYYAHQAGAGATVVNKIDKGLALVGLTFLLEGLQQMDLELNPMVSVSADGENTELGVSLGFLESICALYVPRMISSTSWISFSLLDLEGFVKLTKSIDIQIL